MTAAVALSSLDKEARVSGVLIAFSHRHSKIISASLLAADKFFIEWRRWPKFAILLIIKPFVG